MIEEELLTIDEVAFSPPFPNPAPTDAAGELAWIEVRDLRIDPNYQRPVGLRGEKNIRQVIENFSWSLFSPLVVCRRPGGLYAVIDGQHRAIAARTHGGIDKVPALIINGDRADEAKAFSVINGAVTRITETAIWHARKVAGDSDAVRIEAIFDRCGVSVPRSPRVQVNMKKGETTATGAIENIYRKHGATVLELTLRTVVDTKNGNPGFLRAPLLAGTALVLSERAEWHNDFQGVIAAVKTVGIKFLWETAEARKFNVKEPMHVAYANTLRALLQKELSNKKVKA